MKHPLSKVVVAVATTLAINTPANSGVAGKLATPMSEIEPYGAVTFGGKFSEDLQSQYLDVITALYHTDNAALFLNLRGTLDDSDQEIYSVGLGFRYLLDGPQIILGGNVFYDHINSSNGNDISQFGFGAEVLSKWVDLRFNYYLPEDDKYLVRSFTVNNRRQTLGPLQLEGNQFIRAVRTRTVAQTFGIFEQGLEGWNAEAGFLVPGLEKWMELRVFGGAYSYEDPKGGDITGFKARAEARVTQGVTFDLEYWDDEQLTGGNWVGGVRVSMPFELGNIFQGKNPFVGAGDVFKPIRSSNMRDRLDEMVIRSHRVQTGTSNPQPIGNSVNVDAKVLSTDRSVMPPITAPPSGGGGGEDYGESSERPEGQGEGEFPDGPPS